MDLGVQILRILCAAVEEKSFSGAARRLKITQPTVSQQIARLESEIDGKIFERTGRMIHLTTIGEKLYRTAKDIVLKADTLASDLKEHRHGGPVGLVKYAMPESCQWTPAYRNIMSLLGQHTNIQVDIRICPNARIHELLRKSEIDFAFVTGEVGDFAEVVEKFADEHYSLVAKSAEHFSSLLENRFSEFRLISFPGNESFFITWADAFGLLTRLRDALSCPQVKIGNMIGAIHAAMEGAGALVVPTHCVVHEIARKELVVYRPESGSTAVQPIFLIKRPQEVLPQRCQLILDLLIRAKKRNF